MVLGSYIGINMVRRVVRGVVKGVVRGRVKDMIRNWECRNTRDQGGIMAENDRNKVRVFQQE